MKTGNIVKIYDGSYCLKYDEEKKKLVNYCGINLQKETFEIIATDCCLPVGDDGKRYNQVNNTIVRSCGDKMILFTQERFCEIISPKKKCFCPYINRIDKCKYLRDD